MGHFQGLNSDQSPAQPTTGSAGPRAYIDRLSRRRDRHGNRLPSRYAYQFPYGDDTPIDQTPLRRTGEVIGQQRPARASYLSYLKDHCVHPANARFEAARDEAEAEKTAWNALANSVNPAIDATQASLEQAADSAARPHRARAAALDGAVVTAHDRATQAVAAMGRSYDPAVPTADALLAVERADLGECAAALGLPDPREDANAVFSPALSWLFTMGIGGLLGLSLGVVSGAIELAELATDYPAALLLSVLACGPAALMRKAIFLGHREASQRGSLGRPWPERIGVTALALGFDAAVLAVDVLVERSGLLKALTSSSDLRSLSSGPLHVASDPSTWAAALLVTLGYVATTAWEGYLAGRKSVLLNLLTQEQSERYRTDVEAHRQRPEVQKAVAAVQQVEVLLHRIAEHERQAVAAERPFRERIERLEGGRLDYQQDLTPQQCARIQDALDNLLGADAEFRSALERELELVEPQELGASDLFQQLFRSPYRGQQYSGR